MELGQFKLEGVETTTIEGLVSSRFDLEFHFFQEQDGLRGELLFSTDLYTAKTISSVVSIFQAILDMCLDEPEAKVASVSLLTNEAYTKLDQMGLLQLEKTAYPREASIANLFRHQAAVNCSRIAVKDSLTEMTYAQLNALSDRLDCWLSAKSLVFETLVGVFADRSCQTIVALLGILKAGLACFPFDVKIPGVRMETILSSIEGPKLILVGNSIRLPKLGLDNVEFVRIVEALNKTGEQFVTKVASPSATSLAYVMFTSGSIGELLIEGPILARGYLNEPEKTEAVFINDPVWLLKGHSQFPGRRARLYKTGNLAYHDADGNLVYVGCKDGRIKVRGQRVELSEIEHHIHECMPSVTQVAVV